MAIKIIPPEYPNDLIHLDRWMCPTCGLIFDYLPESGPYELGWPIFDPPIESIIDEMDTLSQFGEIITELCPRCNCNLSDKPLIRIFVSTITNLDDIKPIIERGENEQVEFMEKFPDNSVELAKEIAAFSTTRGGQIFLGINDKGEIVGLENLDSPEKIDILTQRIRGVAAKVEPKVDIGVDIVSEKGIHVAIITVRKGFFPYYKCEGRTYIRNLDESRRATVNEELQLVCNWREKLPKNL